MTTPSRSYIDRRGDRIYYGMNPNDLFYSVTTILRILHKPWLAPWYSKVTAENAVEVMMEMQYGNGDWFKPFLSEDNEIDWEDIAKLLAESPTWERDSAGERGDAVHEICEDILKRSKGNPRIASEIWESEKDKYDSDTVVSRVGYFIEFLRDNKVSVLDIEPMLYNDTHGYAGSCDCIMYINDNLYFVDIKTSAIISDTFALQVSAYAHAEYIIDELGNRREVPVGNSEGAVLQLLDGSAKLVEVDISEEMFEAFISLLLVRRLWTDTSSKEAIGKTLWSTKKNKSKGGGKNE